MKKHKQLLAFKNSLVAVILVLLCLIGVVIYHRYQSNTSNSYQSSISDSSNIDDKLTPKISEEALKSPLKIDTTSITYHKGEYYEELYASSSDDSEGSEYPYRLPKNIDKLVGTYEGYIDGEEHQISIYDDGTYVDITRSEGTEIKPYVSSSGEIKMTDAYTYSADFGILEVLKNDDDQKVVLRKIDVTFKGIDEEESAHSSSARSDYYGLLKSDDTIQYKNIELSNSTYLMSDGTVDVFKSIFEPWRQAMYARYQGESTEDPKEAISFETFTGSNTLDISNEGSVLVVEDGTISKYVDSVGSGKLADLKSDAKNSGKLKSSSNVYDFLKEPVEDWSLEEFLTPETSFEDFVQVTGIDLGNVTYYGKPYTVVNARLATDEEIDDHDSQITFTNGHEPVNLQYFYVIEAETQTANSTYVGNFLVSWNEYSGTSKGNISQTRKD